MKAVIVYICIVILFVKIISSQCKGHNFGASADLTNLTTLAFYSEFFTLDSTNRLQDSDFKTLREILTHCFQNVSFKIVCVASFIISLRQITRNRVLLKNNDNLLTKLDNLQAILNSIGVGVISTDFELKITYMNKTAGKMCGWCPLLAKGRRFGDIVRFVETNNEIINKEFREEICSPPDEGIVMLHSHEEKYIDVNQATSSLLVKEENIGAVTLLQDVSSTRELMRSLDFSATHDSLTGLPNRVGFEKFFQSVINGCKERNSHHALVFVDLDGFKSINDISGHAAGDELLKQIAHLMQSQLRHSDFVARFGGDEFCLILLDCDLTQANVLIKHLINLINEYSFYWKGSVRGIGASAGIAKVDASRSNMEKLLSEADEACYVAKRRGKRQVCVFNELP